MSIGIDIGGQPGAISASVVRDSLDDLLALLGDAVKASDAGAQDWKISDLRIGSAIMAVSAADEAPVAALLRSGLAALTSAAAIPVGWNRRMVARIRDLGQRVGHGGATTVSVTGIGRESLAITPEVVANAERALGVESVSYGSFRGTVDRWNEHGKREIGLDLDGGGTIKVTYPADLAERVRAEALKQRIEVWGLVDRNPAGQATAMTMDGFEVLPERRPVSIDHLRGVFADESGEPWFTLDEWLAARGD
jgi:hypothetical protein